MRTVRCSGRVSCHACLPAPPLCMPFCHACPFHTHPLPCMPPCHTHPSCQCMPPAMYAPCHACPPPHMPPTTHTTPSHTCPPPDRMTDACDNITFPQLLLRTVNIKCQFHSTWKVPQYKHTRKTISGCCFFQIFWKYWLSYPPGFSAAFSPICIYVNENAPTFTFVPQFKIIKMQKLWWGLLP